jgi:hypothetical protein
VFGSTISHLDPTFGDLQLHSIVQSMQKSYWSIQHFNLSFSWFFHLWCQLFQRLVKQHCPRQYMEWHLQCCHIDNVVIGERGIYKGQGYNHNWNFRVMFNIPKVLIVVGTHLPSHFAMGPNLSMHLVPKVIYYKWPTPKVIVVSMVNIFTSTFQPHIVHIKESPWSWSHIVVLVVHWPWGFLEIFECGEEL